MRLRTSPRRYPERMADRLDQDVAIAPERDVLRGFVAALAVVAGVSAAVSDPAAWPYVLSMMAAAGLLVVWAWRTEMSHGVFAALALAVIALVVVAKSSGALDTGLLLISLLAIAIAGWPRPLGLVIALGASAVATPALVVALNPGDTDLGVWLLGIAVPFLMSWGFRRQEQLSAELEAARRRLVRQAVAEERRLIARDVHDLVGHALAGVLVQITSARHVLRRDVDAAEEALITAETAGRRGLAELRSTVAMLRSEASDAVTPVPGLDDLGDLVDQARDRGLDVAYRTAGDHAGVDAVVGLTVYRIGQEALVNAARHAPGARTEVVLDSTLDEVRLRVRSIADVPFEPARAGAGYGLIGMRERAEVVSGALAAGPADDGWLVTCAIPLTTPRTGADTAPAAEARR